MLVALGHLEAGGGGYAPSSYLAVDLFFVLSGFVIAHSYDARLPQIGFADFILRRIARLWPFYALGLALGVGGQLYGCVVGQADAWPLRGLATLTVAGFFLLPLVGPGGAAAPLFGLNPPAWSLYFELAANTFYGLSHRWLRGPALGLLIATAAAGVAVAAIRFNGLDIGWNPLSFLGGVVRVGFGFFMGVWLYRRRDALQPRWAPPPGLLFTVVALALLAPAASWRAIYDLAFVFILAPLIVVLGAAREPGRWLAGPARGLGLISYGLYAVHEPVYELIDRLGVGLWTWRIGALLAGLSAIVLVLDRVYDQPVRAQLARLLADHQRARAPLPLSSRRRGERAG